MAVANAQVGIRVAFNAALAAGLGALYTKVRDRLFENEQFLRVAEQLKEWSDALVGAAVVAVYELFRDRLPANRLIDTAVAGFAIYSMGKSFEVAFGEPYVLVTTDGKAYIKNVPELPGGGWEAYIDNVKAHIDADGTIRPSQDVTAGPHDVGVLGAGKAASRHQYIPAIAAQTGGGQGGTA